MKNQEEVDAATRGGAVAGVEGCIASEDQGRFLPEASDSEQSDFESERVSARTVAATQVYECPGWWLAWRYEYDEAMQQLYLELVETLMTATSLPLPTTTASAAPDDDDGDAGEVEDDDDNLSDLSDVPYQSDDDGLNYDWELVGGPTGSAGSKMAAKADAAAFEASDGMVARVEPLWTLIRLWITVKPSRLYEGLGPAAVDALGLDPTKGVMVMLTTDQLYTSSNLCPRVLWVRQVDDGNSDGDPCPDESVGSIFPLQWMLCKRLQEHLSQNWPPPLRHEREPSPPPSPFPPGASSSSHPYSFSSNLSRPSSFGTTSNSGGRGGVEHDAGGGGGASYFAGGRQSLELEQEQGLELEEAVVVGGDGALARLLGWDCDSVEVRKAVEAVRECTGVSAELAEYALRSAKCVQQAQLNLLDDDPRASLELALQEDRRVGIAELQKELPLADREVIEQAVVANPGSLLRQRIHVRKVQQGVILSPTAAAADAAAATATAAAAAATAAAATTAAAGKKRGGKISWGGLGSGRSAAASTTTTTVTGGIRAAAAAAVTAASGLRAGPTASSGGGGDHGGGGGGGGGSDADAGDADCGEGGGDDRRAKLSSWWRNKKLKRRGSRPSEGENKDGKARNMGGGGRGEEGDVGSVVLAYLSPEEEREHRRAWLEHRAAANFLLEVGLFVTKKVQNANKNCLVCDDPIEGFLPAVPIVCPKELCVMSSQDMGCGTDVESQVARKGHTVDLLIDLFWMSVEGARPELACPDITQWGSVLKPNTWKIEPKTWRTKETVWELRRALAQFPSVTEMQLCIERKRLENGGDATHDGGSGGGSGNVRSDVSSGAGLVGVSSSEVGAGLAGVSPSEMEVGGGTVAGGGSGAGSEGRFMTLHEALLEKHHMSYHLLRWLLSANRAHLRPLDGAEIIKEIPCQKQFMLVTGTAEREAKFQQMKRDAARNGGAGSFFAFHGSLADNWHGILHLGLKNMSDTKYMTSGKAYGKGIYMAEKLSVALGYAKRKSKSHWPKARTTGEAVIVAVCEVVDKKFSQWEQAEHQYFVVPEEECVATRFLLINPDVIPIGKDVCAKDISARLTRALG